MKKLKHITQLFIAMLILLTIAACDKKVEDNTSKENTSKTENTKTEDDVKKELNSMEAATGKAITSIVDRQIIDKTDTKVSKALNAYYSVLINQSGYIDAYSNENTSINQELDNYYTPNQLQLARFAVLDLDDDRLPEIVLAYTYTTDYNFVSDLFYNILYYRNNQVYSTGALSNRQFGLLKADGTFHWAGSASTWGYATISFIKNEDENLPYTYNNFIYQNYYEQNPKTGEWTGYDLIVNQKHVTKDELDAACKEQNNKPDVTWHEFTEANIKKYFSE